MTRTTTYVVTTVVFVLAASFARAQSSVDSVLSTVEASYSSGAYASAELEARRLVENPLLSDSIHVLAEQWIAFALVAQGNPGLAKEHFLRILGKHPDHELDPIFTSPKILVVFNEAHAAARGRRSVQIDTSAMPLSPLPGPTSFRTILFPGWEQLHQGRRTAGAIFLGAGIATLGTGIAMEFLRSAARKEYLSSSLPSEIESRYQTYRRYDRAETFAFVAFAVVYVASEIDIFTSDSPISSLSSINISTDRDAKITLALYLR